MTDRTREGGPEAYRRRGPFIHAQSFISTLAVLQRSPIGLTKYALDQSVDARLQQACDDFADALPGLKDVRDSVAQIEERVRGEARGKKMKTQPVSNSIIDAPQGWSVVGQCPQQPALRWDDRGRT